MTILLVEDEPLVMRLVRNILNQPGIYEVLTAGSVAEALEIARDPGRSIDLLLSDVVLPGKQTGTDLAEQLKQQRADLRVILMSGYPQGQIMALDSGSLHSGWQFLAKPFVAKQLLDLVAGPASRKAIGE